MDEIEHEPVRHHVARSAPAGFFRLSGEGRAGRDRHVCARDRKALTADLEIEPEDREALAQAISAAKTAGKKSSSCSTSLAREHGGLDR